MVRWTMVACGARDANDGASFPYPSAREGNTLVSSSLHSLQWPSSSSIQKVPATRKPLILLNVSASGHAHASHLFTMSPRMSRRRLLPSRRGGVIQQGQGRGFRRTVPLTRIHRSNRTNYFGCVRPIAGAQQNLKSGERCWAKLLDQLLIERACVGVDARSVGQLVRQLLFVGSVDGANGVGLLNPNMGVKIADGGSPDWRWIGQHFGSELAGEPLALLLDGLEFLGVAIGPAVRVAVQSLRAHRAPVHVHGGGDAVLIGGMVQHGPFLEILQFQTFKR